MGNNAKTRLGRAVVTILKPLLRVLIRNEITVGDFSELVRQAYVDVAYEHFGIPGKKLTYARVAVLTGLSRKEVVRLSKLRNEQGVLQRNSPNRAQRVVNGWMSDQAFLDTSGEPKALPLKGEKGSFAELVARYSGDISLGAVLDELTRIGVVSRDSNDTIRLESLGYIPQQDELEKISVMSICTADLLGTAVHNIEYGESDPYFQRQLVYPAISASTAADFRQQTSSLSAHYLQQLNQILTEEQKSEVQPEDAKRVGFGLYYFEHPINQKDEDNEA